MSKLVTVKRPHWGEGAVGLNLSRQGRHSHCLSGSPSSALTGARMQLICLNLPIEGRRADFSHHLAPSQELGRSGVIPVPLPPHAMIPRTK